MNNRKPKKLKSGASIGVVAPASPCAKDKTEKYCRMLSSCGYNVVLGESVLCEYGYLSGKDDVRARDINSMFADKNIHAVFCLRGGYGCGRIVDKLDIELIAANPKIFLGFSDITVLHSIFNKFAHIITFHGPSVSNCEWGSDDFRYKECMRVLHGGSCCLQGGATYSLSDCQGEICGGNLTLVESLIGTEYEIDPCGKIIILEDVGEKNYAIDRKLNHLSQAGYFSECRAVIFGKFTEGDADIKSENLPLRRIIEDIVVPCGKPIITDIPFGHIQRNPTIPLGSYASITKNTLYIPPSVI